METLSIVTFILGMILGSTMIVVATYVYWKRQIFPIGAIIMTVFGTLLLGLSIWQSAKVQVGVDGNVTASFESFKKEIKEEVKQNNQSVSEKIQDLKNNVVTEISNIDKLRIQEAVDKKIDNGDFEGAIKLDSTNVIAYVRLIEKLVKSGNYSKAVSYYKSLVVHNQSGVGYDVYPYLIFAYDQVGDSSHADILIKQLRIKVGEDISNGYGYYSRSRQIGWLKGDLQKYLTSFKSGHIRDSVLELMNELNNIFLSLTK